MPPPKFLVFRFSLTTSEGFLTIKLAMFFKKNNPTISLHIMDDMAMVRFSIKVVNIQRI